MRCPVIATVLGAALAVKEHSGAAAYDAIGGSSIRRIQASLTASQNTAYLLNTLERFENFSAINEASLMERHKGIETQLMEEIHSTSDESVKLALEQSVTSNTLSLDETKKVYDQMSKFANAFDAVIKMTVTTGATCANTQCGEHASCTDTTKGAACICNEGYVGTGQECKAPPQFLPNRLIAEGSGNLATQAADVSVCMVTSTRLAVVFRDTTRSDIGRIVVGDINEAGMASMSPPEQFTLQDGKAFDPVVRSSGDNRIAVVFRDEDKGGVGWIRGAAIGITQIRGATKHLTWGKPVEIVKSESHKMALVALPDSRFTVFFSKLTPAFRQKPAIRTGESLLASVGPVGEVTKLGDYRFAEQAICRLETVKVSDTAFIIAGRAAPAPDDTSSTATATDQEAIAWYGELVDGVLTFDPNPVNVEPSQTQIWARGLSMITPDKFAYAYQQGSDLKIKMAVVSIDQATHKMTVVSAPKVVRDGFSPYVGMIDYPYTIESPHTLTFYDGGGKSKVNICSWDAASSSTTKCEDFDWLEEPARSVQGVHIGGGKSLMVFTTTDGLIYYGVFGLSKK